MPHTSTQIQGTNLDLRHLLARSKCASKCHASSSYEYPDCTQSHLGLAMQAWRLLWNLPLHRGHCRSKEMKRWCNIPYLVRHFETWKAVASALALLSGPGTGWEPDRLQGKPISNVSASSRLSFRRGVIRYLATGALVCAAVGVNAPHLL